MAVIITGLFLTGALFLDLEILVKASSTVLILTYLLSNLCLLILRESELVNYRPKFKAPLYPYLPISGVAGYGLLLFEMGTEALTIAVVLILSGFFFYWFYGRIRVQREYALLHLVERVSKNTLTSGMLESELKEVIKGRDNLCFDRFDTLVENAIVIDADKGLSLENLFDHIAGTIQEKHGIEAEFVRSALEEQQSLNSTKFLPGSALFEILLDRKDFFQMVIVRLRPSLNIFSDEEIVTSLFIFLMSSEDREFFLQTVASLAQVMHDRAFEKRWDKVKTEQQIRDLIHLGERRRICQL